MTTDQSVVTTVKKRYDKAMAAVLDIKCIVEDVRANVVGAIQTGLEIFNLSVIPFILHNSETWDNIPREAMDMLEKILLSFLRMLLRTPKTTPIPSLLWETGSLGIKSRINMRKLNLYHHILTLEEDDIARKVAETQLIYGYPGLWGCWFGPFLVYW